jgi:uncharacterized protein YggE
MRLRSIRRIVLRLVLCGLGAVMVMFALPGAHGAYGAPAQNAQPLLPQVSVSSSATGAPQTLFATGVVDLPVAQPPSPPPLLSLSVSERFAGTDRDAATRAVAEKVAAVRVALGKIGVPPANIEISNATVFPVYGNSLPTRAPSPEGYTVSENLQVFGVGPDKVDAAIQAALAAGAANANRSSGTPARPPQLDTSAINQAVKQAANQAKTMAQAGAEGLGVTLGSIRNVQVQPPSFPAAAPGSVQLRVSVTVTYDIRQP